MKNGPLANQVCTLGMAAYRAPSLFQPHRAREALADTHAGRIPPLIGYFAGLSSTAITRVAASFGYDIIVVDWEHSTLNLETMTQIVHDIQFMSEGRSMAFVRVPGSYHALISYAMDAGASIIVPQVETVEQAGQIIAAAKFGRKASGSRSAPPDASYLVLLTERLTHHYLSTKISTGWRPLSSRLKVWKLFTTSMSSSQRWATKLAVFGWVLLMPDSVWILSLGVEGDDAGWLKV